MAIKVGDAVLMIGADTSKLDRDMAGMQQRMQKRMRLIGTAVTAVGAAIVGTFGFATKAAIDFEDAFAGVRKTVDATEEEFAVLEQGIRDLTKILPATHEGLARIAEAAGQLGVEKDAILEFTEVMAGLGIATNMTGEEAATTLARFANITGMDTRFFSNLGSVITDLGNSAAGTESEIANMALRLAAAATIVGFTQADIIALAASLVGLGVRAEAGGSAFSRVMYKINTAVISGGEELEKWAAIAGMSAGEFSKRFKEDALSAILDVIGGLDRLQASGVDLVPVLEDVGLTSIRITDALLRTAGAGDKLRATQEQAKTAWEENIALTEEVAKRLETTKSQLDLAKNAFRDIGITLGGFFLPILKDLILSFRGVIDGIGDWIKEHPTLAKVIAGFTLAVGLLMLVIGPLLIALPGLIDAYHLFKIKTIALTIATKAQTVAQKAWNVALLITKKELAILLAGIVMITWALNQLKDNAEARNAVAEVEIERTKALAGETNNLTEALQNAVDNGYVKMTDAILEYIHLSTLAAAATDRQAEAVEEKLAAALETVAVATAYASWETSRFLDLMKQVSDAMNNVSRQAGIYFAPGGIREQLIARGVLGPEGTGRLPAAGTYEKGTSFWEQPRRPVAEQDEIDAALGYAHGGPILGPTALTSLRTGQTYAIAGEAGPEVVGPAGGGRVNVYVYLDDELVGKKIGARMVDDIILHQGPNVL